MVSVEILSHTSTAPESAAALLQSAYTSLDFDKGDLLEAADRPTPSTNGVWVDKGDWLTLAKTVDADKVFFVDNNPVIVFARQETADAAEWQQFFNRVWCMALPQLFFLAQPGELCVYDLTLAPARRDDEETRRARLLATATTSEEVQSLLKEFQRERIESGSLFEERHFGVDNRADHALIRDLKKVRESLRDDKLPVEHVHALIGRSIFIRYLEDRGVLIDEYFLSLAKTHPAWTSVIETALEKTKSASGVKSVYAEILPHKSLVYDVLFKQLNVDFNGDMFRSNAEEKMLVSETCLQHLQAFLLGKIEGPQLFFFAYKFEIIPIELISSIYEEFYCVEQGKSDNQGSFYTPRTLVDFVLSQTLTDELLNTRPRILDPACGSGIFLVEAFRRIVRHRVREKNGQRLSRSELRKVLRDQIAGIDINPEAVRVAAFSLYLALLHFQHPPDILNNKRLPCLTYDPEQTDPDPKQRFDILLPCNAFDIEAQVANQKVLRRFASNSVDVVVGNPPWGNAKGTKDPATQGKSKAITWCEHPERGKSVGDEELSQAFIHRTLDLLRTGGRAGLLVSTGVFFKHHPKSSKFRQQWLTSATLRQVVNFTAVRDIFFSRSRKARAIAPFASVVFDKTLPGRTNRFPYWSAKNTAFIEGAQTVVLSLPDVRTLRQEAVMHDDELWKVYWQGGHRDEALIQALRLETSFKEQVSDKQNNEVVICSGFKEGPKNTPSGCLCNFTEFPTKAFERYGPLPELIESPHDGVERRRFRELYEGLRLVIGRGIRQKGGANGRIIARLESESFCFRDSIYGVRLLGQHQENAKILLGILWSSLVRYYLWMTSGSWGGWHYDIKQTTIERIPVRLPEDLLLRKRIENIVDKLRNLEPQQNLKSQQYALFRSGNDDEERLEKELDEAIFDLYELTPDERDLILDMCSVGLDFFYQKRNSDAVKTAEPAQTSIGRYSDLPPERDRQTGLEAYLAAFLDIWNRELAPNGEFRWRIIRPDRHSSMLAAVFESEEKNEPLPPPGEPDEAAWTQILTRLDDSSLHPFGSKRIYIDGLVRLVTKHDIVIIKRNERRLWTRTAAREDAEAAILQAVRKQARHNEEGDLA